MKFTPAARALAMIRIDADSSVGPPNIIVPRQSGETFNPLRPSLRYSNFTSEALFQHHGLELGLHDDLQHFAVIVIFQHGDLDATRLYPTGALQPQLPTSPML